MGAVQHHLNGSRSAPHADSRTVDGPSGSAALDLSMFMAVSRSGAVSESAEPEVRQLTFGILPLTDCAPISVGHSKGFFAKHGIESKILKFRNWTETRDGLMGGQAHAAQMLFGMPVAAAIGKLGADHRPLVIPWILSRNGQAITVSVSHRELLNSSARDLRALARERRDSGRPLVFAMTLQPGTHAMWLRYLARGGRSKSANRCRSHHHPAAHDGRQHARWPP